jgi:hypothetical protein
MGVKKDIKRKLAFQEHIEKIEQEQAKPQPNWQLTETWEKTTKNIRARIEKLEKRLKR